jgi:hypothetical protein
MLSIIQGKFFGKSSDRFSHDLLRTRIQITPILRSLSTALYRNNKLLHSFPLARCQHFEPISIVDLENTTVKKTLHAKDISKSDGRTIDHGSMGTMTLWSIAVSLDFE